jgi:hypothetical protein
MLGVVGKFRRKRIGIVGLSGDVLAAMVREKRRRPFYGKTYTLGRQIIGATIANETYVCRAEHTTGD